MRRDRLWGLFGSLCFVGTGCFSYAPYGHPGAFAPPPHTAMAPQPYGAPQIPPGTVWVPASPSGAAGSANVTAPTPVRQPDAAGEAIPEPGNIKPVPAPIEPGKTRPADEVDSFGYDEETRVEPRGVRTSQRSRPRPILDDQLPTIADAAEPEPELADPEMVATLDDDSASLNTGLQTAEFKTQVRSNGVQQTSAQSDKYGYDAEGYTWLKGILEFDPREQVWHLTYSQTPDATDQLGGEVTIKNTPHFKYARNHEAVQVEGQLDLDSRDRLGKPLYEVTRIIRPVTPRTR